MRFSSRNAYENGFLEARREEVEKVGRHNHLRPIAPRLSDRATYYYRTRSVQRTNVAFLGKTEMRKKPRWEKYTGTKTVIFIES
jgi:hypothetical protein